MFRPLLPCSPEISAPAPLFLQILGRVSKLSRIVLEHSKLFLTVRSDTVQGEQVSLVGKQNQVLRENQRCYPTEFCVRT